MNNILLGNYRITNAIQNENKFEIEGYICHFNVANLNREIVDKKSFDKFFQMMENKQIKPKLNYNHTDNIIGGINKIDVVEDGLFMKAYINRDVAIVRDMIEPNIRSGEIDSFSTEGYVPGGYDGIVTNRDGSYYVKDFIITAVSVVSKIPADPNATFTLANYIDEYKKTMSRRKVFLL